MRLKELGNQWRVYLNPYDYRLLKVHADDRATKLALKLGAECGLRVNETSELKRGEWRDSTHPDVESKFLKIWGKDTTGEHEDGKYRAPYLPSSVFETMAQHIIAEQIPTGDPMFSVTKRTIQKWIKDTAKTVADETGNDDYRKISSHDLRAYFATDHLIRKDMNIEVIMEVGGWESRQTIRPYLHAAFDDVIAKEFKDAEID